MKPNKLFLTLSLAGILFAGNAISGVTYSCNLRHVANGKELTVDIVNKTNKTITGFHFDFKVEDSCSNGLCYNIGDYLVLGVDHKKSTISEQRIAEIMNEKPGSSSYNKRMGKFLFLDDKKVKVSPITRDFLFKIIEDQVEYGEKIDKPSTWDVMNKRAILEFKRSHLPPAGEFLKPMRKGSFSVTIDPGTFSQHVYYTGDLRYGCKNFTYYSE